MLRNFLLTLPLFLLACSREPLVPAGGGDPERPGFTRYTIRKGAHYAEGNVLRSWEGNDLRFTVFFDSSAVYTTRDPGNQADINKLYGFSDNGMDHHSYSARFGWAWTGGALRLYAYVYNGGKVTSQELKAVPIGKDIELRLQADGNRYLFTVGEDTQQVPRTAPLPIARGYGLYPYFGGDEPAPHNVHIFIR